MEITIDSSKEFKLNWNAKGAERIAQNVYNILCTYKSEVAYNRDFGISSDIFDKDTETIKSILTEDLFDNIKKYEPRAKLKSIIIKGISDGGDISAIVKIEI